MDLLFYVAGILLIGSVLVSIAKEGISGLGGLMLIAVIAIPAIFILLIMGLWPIALLVLLFFLFSGCVFAKQHQNVN